jgi:DNA polymerase-3 subunit epsilon
MLDRERFAPPAAPEMEPTSVAAGRIESAAVATARVEAVAWARSAVADPAVVYLDTETTGLDRFAEIVEIAVLDAVGRVIVDTLVRPKAAIPPIASAIHGIYDAHLERAPTWPEIHASVSAALAGRQVIVYNAAFDRRMVAQSCARHGLEAPAPIWSCAMGAYASFRGILAGRGSYRRHKLEDATATFGGPVAGHRAAGDALACRAVVVGMANTAR